MASDPQVPSTQQDVTRDTADRLVGWKAIASYLGRDIRTVQRWEASEQLPVHRLEHQRQASAYAFRSELDAWQRRHSTNPPSPAPEAEQHAAPRRWPWGIALVLVSTTAVVIALLLHRSTDRRPLPTGEDTKSAEAYAAYAEGKALYAARQYRQALVSLERGVARDPGYGSAWAVLAKTYGRLAQPVWAGGAEASEQADRAARKAAELAPRSADTRIALALAARARGDLDTWRREAQRAVDIDPHAAEAYALLGDSYAAVVYTCNRDQDPERADGYYRKALELAPDMTTAISNRAGNLRRMGRYQDCIDILDKAVRSFRDEPPLRATRGACRLMLGDIEGATEDIEALRGNPKMAPAGALVYLGLLALKTGRAADGVRELEQTVATSPSPRSHLIVAEAYVNGGDIGHAVEHMKHAFSAEPACAGMVGTSLAFRSVRNLPEVATLLASYGIR